MSKQFQYRIEKSQNRDQNRPLIKLKGYIITISEQLQYRIENPYKGAKIDPRIELKALRYLLLLFLIKYLFPL